MEPAFRDAFLSRWRKYFGPSELPITWEYTDADRGAELARATEDTRCLIDALEAVRKGQSLRFDSASFGCAGGKYYCGYSKALRRGIEEFLSHDAVGEGERYKKTPEIAGAAVKQVPHVAASARQLVFKRWDALTAEDDPTVAVFFASPDVLSGLFTLAGYDESQTQVVIVPFGSGCSTIIQYPLAECQSEHPRAVLGLLDVSARSLLSPDRLSFSVPLSKLRRMTENMDESFLITDSWEKVRKRIST